MTTKKCPPTIEWISAAELPDSDIDVLVALPDGITVWIGHHDGEDWIVNDLARPVDYWTELPLHPETRKRKTWTI